MLQAHQARDYLFDVTNGERESRVSLAASAVLPLPGINDQNKDQCRGKKNCPAPTASTGGTCLSLVNTENASMPKVPCHLYLVNCFQQGSLEFDGPVGQCFSRFPTVSKRSLGRRRGGRGREEKSTG